MLHSIKIFADGANLRDVERHAADPRISGFTTNPTLMRHSGVANYRDFARELLAAVPDRPISLEVLADDCAAIERQAREIASWGQNVYVKVPVTTTDGTPLVDVIGRLAADGVQVNVTAMMTLGQVEAVARVVAGSTPSILSIFAGRIADSGRDPVPIVQEAVGVAAALAPRAEILWASPREVLNAVQAQQVGCHIITMTDGLLSKLDLLGRDLEQFSLETVRMFRDDALAAAYEL